MYLLMYLYKCSYIADTSATINRVGGSTAADALTTERYLFNPNCNSHQRGESRTSGQPRSSELYQNYPNPFNSETVLRFDLARREQRVDLRVYSIDGQRVTTLVSGPRAAGSYVVRWNGRDDEGKALASGIYMYRLEAENLVEVRKLLLLR